jgi:cyclic beta-1,2-glucan synthetase
MIVQPTDVTAPVPATSAAGTAAAEAANEPIGRLDHAAREAAKAHSLQPPAPDAPKLTDHLAVLEDALRRAHRQIAAAAQETLAISYASEWLLDNFYVVEQALDQVEQDMPAGFYRKLPKLGADAPLPGYPRVYALAHTYLAREDYQVDPDRLVRYVLAYQRVQPLTLSEVWALPVMLRLVLLEVLTIGSAQITQTPDGAGTLASIEPRFQSIAAAAEGGARQEDTVASAIPSLRQLDVHDWLKFSEQVSVVHHQLEDDPADVYSHMDFDTRNRYRSQVEELAAGSAATELDVARAAVALAAERASKQAAQPSLLQAAGQSQGATASRADTGRDGYSGLRLMLPPDCHVGYYLIDAGRRQLEAQLGYRAPVGTALRRWVLEHATLVYLGPITAISLLVLLLGLGYASAAGATWLGMLAVALLAAVPAITIGVTLIDLVVPHLLPPRTLPKLDFVEGIPAACSSLVVIPGLIGDAAGVDDLFGQLEQHYLRNPDPELRFALLTDFHDAPSEIMTDDAALIAHAQSELKALNARYAHRPFYFLHRRRLWNPAQQVWMGWERKRGKLHELNRLLRGADDTSFAWIEGERADLGAVRYVITLDADTVLPRDGATKLVGTLAHPLNTARFDGATGRVARGYTVLQPRVEIKPTSAERSLFARVFAGDTGLDLYTLAVSDTYQDLFGAGIFIGKGIYDVDAFERSLDGRVPENTLLSHDLFEGMHGRAGLVTDVVVYEDYPANYLVDVRRAHRWVRGDWQLLPWLLPKTPRVAGRQVTSAPNDLPLIDRWKILDNLRRSLLPVALLALFLMGWTLLPGSPAAWTFFGLLTPLTALAAGVVSSFIRMRPHAGDVEWRELLRPLRDAALRWLLYLAFLPVEAWLAIDAVARTLIRMYVTRRNLLEWTTAASAAQLVGDVVTPAATLKTMLPAVVFVFVAAVVVAVLDEGALPAAAPLLLAWLLAAPIAYWISQPVRREVTHLTQEQRQHLRALARRTWLFYVQFVGPDDNWLPPDHFQESPNGVVAHRTSPTNVGLYLLSTLAAHDLGYLGTVELALRIDFAFAALNQQERYRGHFLNWIDTITLQPLLPRYVSTVDSGNLAACLIALNHGLRELPQEKVWHAQRWEGVVDTFTMLMEVLSPLENEADETLRMLCQYLSEQKQRIATAQPTSSDLGVLLPNLTGDERRKLEQLIAAVADSASTLDAVTLQTVRIYATRAMQYLDRLQRELETTLPWIAWLRSAPDQLVGPQASPVLAEHWSTLVQELPADLAWADVPAACSKAAAQLVAIADELKLQASANHGAAVDEAIRYCEDFRAALDSAKSSTSQLLADLARLTTQAETYVQEMDFGFLYNERRDVFHIGYNVDSGTLDNSYYDLLASEARIASLLAIAKGDVPQRHWLHLARPLTQTSRGSRALLSWSGTMFEYLMPPLLLGSYPGTLLYQTAEAAIEQQIDYGRHKGVPWGISESGFFAFDAAYNYQYRAFGVPGLGFKRGLADDMVVAPYASLLALPFRPGEVMQNIEKMQDMQLVGRYGLYEAVDFTAARLAIGQEYAVVRSYMSHHQGMILLALAAYLQGPKMVARFHAEPMNRSVELLLQERIPDGALLRFPHQDETDVRAVPHDEGIQPWRVPVDTPMPIVHYLSNGHFSTMITNAGSGFSQCDDLVLTRWRADTTCDDWGRWLYVRDLDSGAIWSAGRQPTGVRGEHEEIVLYPHAAELRRRDQGILLHMQVTVAPGENVEIRRVTLTNDSNQPRRIGIASYSEAVLAPAGADRRHQAFTKLFVESEYLPTPPRMLLRRRPRAATESAIYMVHALVSGPGAEGEAWGHSCYEGDRSRFVGRGRTTRRPALLEDASWWEGRAEGSSGATLDPVVVLGQEIRLAPHSSIQLALITLVGENRQEALGLARRFSSWSAVERAFTRAQSSAERELRQFGPHGAAFERAHQVLSLLTYAHPVCRSDAATLAANGKGQSGLWAYGISGDYPILLLRMTEEAHGDLLLELLLAHRYWRRRGLLIDLVVLNEQDTNYGQSLQNYIYRQIRRLDSDAAINQRGGIYLVLADQLGEADRVLLKAAARVVLDGREGELAQQLENFYREPAPLPLFATSRVPRTESEGAPAPARPDDLHFDNELGGFSPDGKEYVIYLPPGAQTPAPWINVVANAEYGFLASESGGGYSWAGNSGENRLTTWRNDPVSDIPSEAIYLRDEETAEVWSPTPLPAPAESPYLVRHGAGYTSYAHQSHELDQQLRVFVAPDAPAKILHLRLENKAPRPRRITVTFYAEWVLGVDRASAAQFLVPEFDAQLGALMVRNPYSSEFGARVAFAAASRQLHGMTADRAEFLGRLGSLQQPAALSRIGLAGRVQAGLDPCAALQLHVDMPPGGVDELHFVLGQGEDRAEALAIVERLQRPEEAAGAWQATHDQWEQILGAVEVETPDRAMNLLLNRWLLYQSLSCRVWGRSALYQSSGAYGFRDQLQDVMALVHARPDIARAQILRAARHQFEAGDVLHWWHPPSGRGVRTRISDDLLWLPYVTAHYIAATGDRAVLEEQVPFLAGEPLRPHEEERYDLYPPTATDASLLEHCRRALAKGLTAGVHGIPLMGAGDWNDGMNRVGIEGKGESIWLGWFLCATLEAFAALLLAGDEASDQAAVYRAQADAVRHAIEQHGWDGEWYRRAYYDDGSLLGSAQNKECRIDAIAQSWGILSGAAEPDRARQAMRSVQEQLIRRSDRLILLFTPPFDKTPRDPGYIKGYLPGIRENGGQYTHAALWTIWAFAALGDGDEAEALFRLINPIYRSNTGKEAAAYKVEPYVISADVYGVPPHVGRGGWTWYTGSASWMYRLGVEAILGLRRMGDRLRIEPCIPQNWQGYRMRVRYGRTLYIVRVQNPDGACTGVKELRVDGRTQAGSDITLVDDGRTHEVCVRM